MEHLIRVTVYGLISGIIGTGLGGIIAFFIGNASNRILSFIIEFSAGIMTSVVCFELIPEAFDLGGVYPVFIGLVSGVAAIILIEDFIKKSDLMAGKYKNSSLLKAGMLMAIGIALHNLPEGFAVGSGFEASTRLGFTITGVIVIHDIPEGIAMAVPMRAGGVSKLKTFVYTLLSGVPMGIGAFIGAALGNISSHMIAACLSFAGGAMLYIVLGEMIPESKRIYLGRLSSVGNIIGIICGIIISKYNS
ncbi:MAG TPA: ZIP family metal transporter [Clostridiaceae bacterium]|nr:ZIP family metal transporter [Clostridiaceae bacterium]